MRKWLLAAILGALVWPSEAEACAPWSGVVWVSPSAETTLPANGIVVVRGVGMDASWFRMYVDGEQVEAELIDRLSGSDSTILGEFLAFRPVELPPVGSELALEYCDSPGGCHDYGPWTIGDVDDTPPPAPTVQYDYFEYIECSANSCQNFAPERTGYVQVGPVADEPKFVSVRVRSTQDRDDVLYFYVLRDPASPMSFGHANVLTPGVDPQSAVCIEVRVFDLAGNEAEYGVDTCAPCHIEYATELMDCAPTPQEWTDDELYAGGDCDGTSIEPLPPLPAPLEPTAGSTGGSTSGSESSDGGGQTTNSWSTGTGAGETSTTDDSTSSGAPPAGSSGAEPPDAPVTGGGSSSSGAGAADDSIGRGCRVDQPSAPGWFILGWFGLVAVRRND